MTHDIYKPKPEHKFTFGLWTVGNRGRDPFGDATRASLSPVEMLKQLSALGAYGVNLHDNDLVPIDAPAHERDRIVNEFKQALNDYGMKVPMATTNLSTIPSLRTARSLRATRAYACMRSKKPCGRWTWERSLARRSMFFGAAGKARKSMRQGCARRFEAVARGARFSLRVFNRPVLRIPVRARGETK